MRRHFRDESRVRRRPVASGSTAIFEDEGKDDGDHEDALNRVHDDPHPCEVAGPLATQSPLPKRLMRMTISQRLAGTE